MSAISRFIGVLCLGLTLVSCGGSGGEGGGNTPVPPDAPTGVTAIAVNQQVMISWKTSSNATAYHVKRALTAGGPYTEVSAPSAVNYTDTGLANGTAYYYVVSASNADGESANSVEVAATPSTDLPVLPENDPTQNYLGMNVWFINDWDGGYAFVDAMKHARPWQDAGDWHNPVAGVDEFGWPTADASTVIYSGWPDKVNGTYKLMFNGQADLALMWTWGRGSITNQVYDEATNTTTADLTYDLENPGSVGIILTNTRRTPSSPLNSGFTNMRLYRPGYPTDGSVVFTKELINALKKVKVLRLMDWSVINSNLTVHWADRITPRHMSKTGPAYTGPGGQTWSESTAGVALEHQIQLCNEANVDCWINIPVVADDDYIRNMALALRYGTDGTNPYTSYTANPVYPPLKPNLRIYLEYANEVWNSAPGFQSFNVIMDIVKSLPADHELFNPALDNIWMNMWRYPAYRMLTVSNTFRSVYGDASMMNRVRPMLMAQQGNGQMSLEQPLIWLDAYLKRQPTVRPINYYFYGAGGSGYYNHDIPAEDWGKPDVYFAKGLPAQNILGMSADAIWAANYGLKRIAYEGGPSLDFYSEAQANAINLDPRMQELMVNTHDAWSAGGGDLLVYYTVRGPGPWEFTPDMANLNTPKFKALDQLNSQPRAAVTLGQALPGDIAVMNLRNYMARTGYDYLGTIEGQGCIAGNDPGEWIAFPGHTTAAFNGQLQVKGHSYSGAELRVWINGVAQGQATLDKGDGNTQITSSSLNVAVPKGLAVVRLEVLSGDFTVCTIGIH